MCIRDSPSTCLPTVIKSKRKASLRSEGASFSFLQTSIGIVIKDSSGSTVVPNQFYDVPGFNNNQGVWNLTAAPIAKPGSIIPEGEFDAAATVVAQFQ